MDCVTLSLKSLREESLKLAAVVEREYKPDLVVYIARGGYLIGKDVADYFQVPCVGIHAERRGGGLKEKVAPLLRILPASLKKALREVELKSGVHKVDTERNEFWDRDDFDTISSMNIKNILIVDDSVDTGYSMLQVRNRINADMGQVNIKVAAINVWSKSYTVCKTDYSNYKDTIISTPMSKDSQEYPIFEDMYNRRNEA
ncbi:phosphoribosyltransferase [uncultured Dialister sp.]|uniref:phosphoribosyltransferase n=1 Tax=uncultured Dialister sp. TaxID=278064 RepID=UPI002595FB9B|nr:phosphoribosyltransferase [uncultured Dialister sp.]